MLLEIYYNTGKVKGVSGTEEACWNTEIYIGNPVRLTCATENFGEINGKHKAKSELFHISAEKLRIINSMKAKSKFAQIW